MKCDGTKLEPKVTPADAQWILNKYLKKGGLDSDCSGNSRTATVTTLDKGLDAANILLTLSNAALTSGGDILIPVVIDSPSAIDSFGFDLAFPASALQFIGLESAELTTDYDQLGANVVPYEPAGQDRTGAGPEEILVLRVGGYKTAAGPSPTSGVLVTLVFRITGKAYEPDQLSIISAQDGLQNATFTIGRLFGRDADPRLKEDMRPGRNITRGAGRK